MRRFILFASLLLLPTLSHAQGTLPEIFAKSVRYACFERGPHAPLFKAAEFYSLIEFEQVEAKRIAIRQAVDSIARFWDGPEGCAALPTDTLALYRARLDSGHLARVRASTIQGPGDLRWGQREADLVSRLGEPSGRQRDSDFGVETLVWPNRSILGEDASQIAVMDPRVGLIEVGLMISPTSGARCESVFRESVAALKSKFPATVKNLESIVNQSVSGANLCDAIAIERGSAFSMFQDSVSQVTATVSVGRDGRQVLVSYLTSLSRDVRKARSFLEKRNTF